jgi:hypothetical protein
MARQGPNKSINRQVIKGDELSTEYVVRWDDSNLTGSGVLLRLSMFYVSVLRE